MNENGRWVTIRGNRVFIKDKDVNDYMNNKIRKKGKEEKYKVYQNNDEILKDYYDEYKNIFQNMEGSKTYEAFKKYQFTAYREINKMLAGENMASQVSRGYLQDLKTWSNLIDGELNNHGLKEDTILFRGTYTRYFDGYKEGDIFNFPIYNSTSFNRVVGEDFVRRKNYGYDNVTHNFVSNSGNASLLEIRAKKGTHGMYMGDYFHGFNEQEYLLPHTTKFRYIKQEKKYSNYLQYDVNVITVEVVE